MYPPRTDVSRRPAVTQGRDDARFGRWTRRAGIAALAFGVAFAVDMATGQRYSQLLGSIAIVVSMLGAWPRVRASAVPIGAYVGVWVGFNLLRALGDEVPWRDRWLDAIPTLEARLFAGELPSIWLQRQFFDPTRIDRLDQISVTVYLSFFVVPHLVAFVLLFRNRDRFWGFLTASVVLFVMGVVAFAALPTNPPWLARSADVDGTALRVTNLVLADAGVRATAPAGSGAMAQHHSFEPNPVATMPSIHLGVTALLALFATGLAWRFLAIVYTVAMAFALVYLGEHYLLDTLAGALAAAVAWAVTRPLVSAFRHTPERREFSNEYVSRLSSR